MKLRNSATQFGLLTRGLHWFTALILFATLPLGAYIARMEPSLSTIWLYGLHKTLGISVLTLVLLRIVWHVASRPPKPLTSSRLWADTLAKWVHWSFYLVLLVVPFSGWVASSATGIDTVVFGSLTLPYIAPASPELEKVAFTLHQWGARLLLLLIVLHIAGALTRAVKGDGTLKRMVSGEAAD